MRVGGLVLVAALVVACGGSKSASPGEATPAKVEEPAAPAKAEAAKAADAEPLGCNRGLACITECAGDEACISTCKERVVDDSSAVLLIEFNTCMDEAKTGACADDCGDDGPACGGCTQDACRSELDACEADQ